MAAEADTATPPLLAVRNLAVTYRSTRGRVVPAVRDVSFTIGRGEVVSLVGESGSGKTTSARAVLGLLGPAATVRGAMELSGRPLTTLSPRQWRDVRGRRIAFIPQDPTVGLNPTRRVGRQIAEAIRVHDRTLRSAALHSRVVELLDRMGLPDPARRARQYPHELSGGMRQRVLIAAALANSPELIVADEPTSALDVTVQQQILDHIDALRTDLGVAVLFITHDLGVAGERSDRIVVLADGEVVETGTPDEILAAPASPYTRRLVAAVPTLDSGRLVWDAATGTARPGSPAAADTGRPLLAATGLHRSFKGGRGNEPIHAVRDVSVSVARGTTLGVVGESGSGKSTLARLLTRLAPADAGRVVLDGQDVTDLDGEALRQMRRRVQIVYQNPFASLDPRFTIGRTLAEPLRAFGIGTRPERRARGAQLLELVGLPTDFLDRLPAELSGGQLQRVAIARALATEPELVVLDEPVSALDVSVQAQILELLVRLQAELGVTMVFISHDLAVIRQVSDTVVVMSRGEVVEAGPADEILRHPRSAYTRALLDAVPGHRRPTPAGAPR
ncbi:ABC transporter ATP-binding protein [Dactylosporangium fulvum]|uniref:ABC transporter ATP-binding protein n=1 Tax=Dactylosporangium fulvum TaxID=53359 RepID=A0ABY5VPF1_9ACTN|nr:ABC transporter ATP-binding protein [Dactylosporangium fulvum]UWP78921.1 ABC transporter ATP-binding protein [Dactylosporangium fulvum]